LTSGASLARSLGISKGWMNVYFDAIYKRFDELETEYYMLLAGLKRVD
jgi:hypothetical protein